MRVLKPQQQKNLEWQKKKTMAQAQKSVRRYTTLMYIKCLPVRVDIYCEENCVLCFLACVSNPNRISLKKNSYTEEMEKFLLFLLSRIHFIYFT